MEGVETLLLTIGMGSGVIALSLVIVGIVWNITNWINEKLS